MRTLKPLAHEKLPNPPTSIFKLLGPSFILIGLGLGTGELILWPYLVSNWGLGIIWGALLGISMQFFLNMEIERYTLVNGESIFVGFARLYKKLPHWFIASTIIAWSWPGFSAASAAVLKPFGIANTTYVAVGMLILVGLILTFGPTLYKTVETFQKTLILAGIPLIIVIVASIVKMEHIVLLSKGLIGIGEGYKFFPDSLPFAAFLGAFAYSGAGGNLNLAQSFYIKDKGYGMGKYADSIASFVSGKNRNIEVEGKTFQPTKEEVKIFNKWWRMINVEHALIFWGLGLLTILLMALLAYATVYGSVSDSTQGLQFIFVEANAVKGMVGPIFSTTLLLVISAMLFSTQLSVIDAAGRIVTENIAILKPNIKTRTYYISIWVLLLFGMAVLLFGMNEPKFLIVLGAVLNAFCMFVFSGLLVKLNTRFLPKEVHPSQWRKYVVYLTFLFFGIFSAITIYTNIL